MKTNKMSVLCAGSLALTSALGGRVMAEDAPGAVNLAHDPTLYVVGYSHLDTEWRWEYPRVIDVDLHRTLVDNFALFEKYPNYIFNFTGAYRYKLMKEYYPEDYAKMKGYIAAGRWYPNGSSVDENDCNNPSAESVFRNVLYGNEYFRHEFGVAGNDYMLPDCFGFPASLPSILVHAGVKGFSTAKLAWGGSAPAGGSSSSEKTGRGGYNGIPFNVGIWYGPDGKGILSALNPGAYDGGISTDLSSDRTWTNRINLDGSVSGVFADYHYYGNGDEGGSAHEPDVKMMEAIVDKTKTVIPRGRGRRGQAATTESNAPVQMGEGPVHVISSRADQFFLDVLAMPATATKTFPTWTGDLEMVDHGVGAYTSEAYRKRWNRKKELLADAAEKASVAAMWLGGRTYPQQRLTDAWMLLVEGQMHDILPGTATPLAYEYVWNDDVIGLNQFAQVLSSATEGVGSALNTQTTGVPIVVYNPLNIEREDVVRATVPYTGAMPTAVSVTGPDGKEVPAQMDGGKVVFLAKVPSVGYAVYDVRPMPVTPKTLITDLKVTESSLENARYRVTLDTNGDVSSLFDKTVNKELLSAPIRLSIREDNPPSWPAWNMDYNQQLAAARGFVQGPAKIRISENGPARVALEVEREAEDSTFKQTIRLSAGEAGNRLEFVNVIDWKTKSANLTAVFPLSAANAVATYNWDVGTIQRPNDEPRNYEKPTHQWIDLTDKSGAYGATILTDCKTGSDKPDDNTLRVTLIRTPGGRGGYRDQTTQDIGHHEIVYGVTGHVGDWRKEQSDWQGERLNQPLISFVSAKHDGALGKSFSMLKLDNSRVRVLALKKAEESDDIIVRVVEMDGKAQTGVHLNFPAAITAAREVNGQEQPLGAATVTGGGLVTDFTPYQLHTFAVTLAAAPTKVAAPAFAAVTLPYDRAVASKTGDASTNGFDGTGGSLPAEMLPANVTFDSIEFQLAAPGGLNAVVPHGQEIALPAGDYQRLYILAAAAGGDQKATFRVGASSADLTVEDWGGFIGQWDTRLWGNRNGAQVRPGATGRATTGDGRFAVNSGMKAAFIKRAPLAWYSTHHHSPEGVNVAYSYSYLFGYTLDIPAGAKTLTLPDNANIRILAATVAKADGGVAPAQPLYDTLKNLDGEGGSED